MKRKSPKIYTDVFMTSQELRQKYLDFFKKHGHKEIPSASLMPENDPSVLFTTAGMHPLATFLLGEKHPAGQRLVNSQKCIRTGDIDEVGDKNHHTFFEMLGHWSIGDPASPDGIGQGGYWKEEAIKMSYEFLTKELGLDPKFLAFTVFVGNENAGKDEEAANAWQKLAVPPDRIAYLEKENWWELPGPTGPCGPCTEMFYWSDKSEPAPKKFDPDDKRWVEIGNDVLMEYEKNGPGKYVPAKQKNIDNGTGLERLLAVLNGLDDDYQTDLFWPIIKKIKELSGKAYPPSPLGSYRPYGHIGLRPSAPRLWLEERAGSNNKSEEVVSSMRIIADHLKAVTFIMGDDQGVAPSNVGQGYVVRKLIRRAIRHGRMIGIQENFTDKIAEVVIKKMSDVYPELERNKKFVLDNLQVEEEKFTRTLQAGLREFEKVIKKYSNKVIKGEDVFNLFQTYGFPLELTKELAYEKGWTVDEQGFNEEFKKHQELSRTAAAGKFKGGLAGQTEMTTKYHTATHLLLAALREVLGAHVFQKGSNITDERLRLDFSHGEKMSAEQIAAVEKIVNEKIKDDLPVVMQEMSIEEAEKSGAMGVFSHKYGDKVKVYTIGEIAQPFSREICGGPHVERTGVLGRFKIIKEEASSSGVRRIKAVLI